MAIGRGMAMDTEIILDGIAEVGITGGIGALTIGVIDGIGEDIGGIEIA
jgi:hypothetical protein